MDAAGPATPAAAARVLDFGDTGGEPAKKKMRPTVPSILELPALDAVDDTNNDAAAFVVTDESASVYAACSEGRDTLLDPQATDHQQISKLLTLHAQLPADMVAAAVIAEACLRKSSSIIAAQHADMLKDVKTVLQNRGLNQSTKAAKKIRTIESHVSNVVRTCAASHGSMYDMFSVQCMSRIAVAHAFVVNEMREDTVRAFAVHACMGSHDFIAQAQEHLHSHAVMTESDATKAVDALKVVTNAISTLHTTSVTVTDIYKSAMCATVVFESVLVSASNLVATTPAPTSTLQVFQAHSINCPQSPPKRVRHFTLERASSPQYKKKSRSACPTGLDPSTPFGMVENLEAVKDFYLAGGNLASTQQQKGWLGTQYVRALSAQAAEFKTNYVNGIPANKVMRQIADPVNSPRYEPMFKFVIPHIAIRYLENATKGEGMFPPFNKTARINDVIQFFNSTNDSLGDRKLTKETIARIVPKNTPQAMFMNHITTTLLCTGVVDHTVSMDATFVAIDLVRATYNASGHSYTPGNGLMTLRNSRVYVVSCDHNLEAKLTKLVDDLSIENYSLSSPEALIEHALVKSTLVLCAGRPCSLTTFNAGVRTAASVILENLDASNIADLRDNSVFGVNSVTVVNHALRAFISTHGNADAIHGTHTALKVYMQQSMTQEALKKMKRNHVASLNPNMEMFSCGAVYSGQNLFQRLTNMATAQHDTDSMLHILAGNI